MVGRKRGSIFGFPLKPLWEKCPARMEFHPKQVIMSWDHLMHAIEVGEGKT